MAEPTTAALVRSTSERSSGSRTAAPTLLAHLPELGGGLVIAIAATVLLGWTIDAPALTGLGPGGTAVLPNTAVSFAALGIALVLAREGSGRMARWSNALSALLGVLVASYGVLIIHATIAGRPLAVDALVFGEKVARLPWRPVGRIALNTALAFTLLGSAIALLGAGGAALPSRLPGVLVARALATGALIVSYLGLVGHAYGVQRLYRFGAVPGGMALATALTLALTSVATLAIRPSRGFAAVVLGDDAGGLLARRLLPMVLIVPFALGALWLLARQEEIIDRESGVAMFVIATTVIFIIIVAAVARSIRGIDSEREALLRRERIARRDAEDAVRAAALSRREAEEARGDAERANRAKSEFLATMSHELRTPLNAIAGYSELLALGLRGPVTAAQQEDLQRIRRAQRRLLGLINDVLNFAKLEAGRVDLQLADVALAEVLSEAETLMGALLEQKSLTLRTAEVPPGLRVRADGEKLAQVLLNLLSNAVKFTAPGGTITVSVVDESPNQVLVAVGDTGPGIPASQLERIFEPFVQLREGHAKGQSEGTGLGLSISRDLVRAMGGELTVRSVVGEGSVFTLDLPRATGERVTMEAESAAEQ